MHRFFCMSYTATVVDFAIADGVSRSVLNYIICSMKCV